MTTLLFLPLAIRCNLQLSLHEFCAIYNILSRRYELERLIEWATRKKLIDPRRLYQSRWADEERRLTRVSWRSPRILCLVRFLFCANQIILPTRHYHAKGSAAKYRSQKISGKRLTDRSKQMYNLV